MHKVAEALYKAQTEGAEGRRRVPPTAPTGEEPEDAEVVDAEYTEEKRED